MGAAGVCAGPEHALVGCANLGTGLIPYKRAAGARQWVGPYNHPMERISDRLKALVAHQEELDRKIQEQHQQLLADLNEHLAQERKFLESID